MFIVSKGQAPGFLGVFPDSQVIGFLPRSPDLWVFLDLTQFRVSPEVSEFSDSPSLRVFSRFSGF